MSKTPDTMVSVIELIEETIGRVLLREIERKKIGENINIMKSLKADAKTINVWISLIDAEMKKVIGGDCDCDVDYSCAASSEEVKHVDGDARHADCDFCFGKCICKEESGNPEIIIIERKEEKFPKYATTGFN